MVSELCITSEKLSFWWYQKVRESGGLFHIRIAVETVGC